jgi:hypothetical protein
LFRLFLPLFGERGLSLFTGCGLLLESLLLLWRYDFLAGFLALVILAWRCTWLLVYNG